MSIESKVTLSGKEPVLSESAPAPDVLDPNTGMNKDYWILSEEERRKGFIRPVRDSYQHLTCRTVTTMHRAIAETYARDPKFYSHTFCVGCGTHCPVSEFVWKGTNDKVGS